MKFKKKVKYILNYTYYIITSPLLLLLYAY